MGVITECSVFLHFNFYFPLRNLDKNQEYRELIFAPPAKV